MMEQQVQLLADMLNGAGWVDAPDIQRAFTKRFGSNIYKPAMDVLRSRRKVEHRYVHVHSDRDALGKSFWQYRLS